MSAGSYTGINSWSRSLLHLSRGKVQDQAPQEKYTALQHGKSEDNYWEAVNLELQEKVILPKTKAKPSINNDPALTWSRQHYRRMQQQWKVRKPQPHSLLPVSEMFREFPRFQITVTNLFTQDKEIFLWGGAHHSSISIPLPAEVSDHALITTVSDTGAVQPQAVLFNPANGLIYVCNQISGTVTVINNSHQIVASILLQPLFPGFSSPVAMAVNTNTGSSNYGYVYVACSLANNISIIDTSLNVIAMIPTSERPVSVAYNPFNNRVYAVNLVAENITVLDSDTHIEVPGSPFPTGDGPLAAGVHPPSGQVYVTLSNTGSVLVYDSNLNQLATITGILERPVSVTYHPGNDRIYIVAADTNRLYRINPQTHVADNTITTGPAPYNSFYNSANNFLYIQNRDNNSLTVLRTDDSIVATLPIGTQGLGGAHNPLNNFLYLSDPISNLVQIIGYAQQSSSILVSDNYAELKEDFVYNPAIIQHTRFTLNGSRRIPCFRLNRFTPTGMYCSEPLSFENYASPQHRLNIAEAWDLAGTLLDNKTGWRLVLPAGEQLSILVWYKQFLRKQELNKTTKTL